MRVSRRVPSGALSRIVERRGQSEFGQARSDVEPRSDLLPGCEEFFWRWNGGARLQARLPAALLARPARSKLGSFDDQVRVLIAPVWANVKITPSYAGLFTGQTGMSHIIVDDLTIMRAMPNMVTVAPADDVEAAQALRWAAAYQGPCYVRLGRDATARLFDETYRFEFGKAVVVREGRDVTLFGTGAQTPRVVEAADLLAADGIEAHIVHLPTLKPLDVPAIIAAADRTGRVMTVEEHSIIGGLGGAVAETLSEHHPTRVDRIGLRDVFPQSGPNDALLDIYGLSAARVAEQVRSLLRPV